MSKKKDIFWRAYLIYFGFVIVLLVAFIKTISLQLTDSDPTFMASSNGEKKMPTRVVKREPRRGQILDANYTPLVTSVSFYDIYMDPTVAKQDLFNKDISKLCRELARIYPQKTAHEYETYIRAARADTNRYLLIRKKVTSEERKVLQSLPIFEKGRLGGGLIDNVEIIERKLPHGELLRRTLGYVQVRADGSLLKVGIEGAFDDFLRGEPGEQVEQRISSGWKKIGPVTKEAVEGANVVTTIDKEIQEVAHAELLNQLTTQDARNGCVIVMEVKTGYVKAIVNLSKAADGQYYELYNHAIGTREVPGSTFKLASLMALLEDGKVSIHDRVQANGVYQFYGRKLEDSNHGIGYGEISIQEAFEKSSNVFSRIIFNAYKSDPDAYIRRLKQFGLADSLGIVLSGEPKPVMHEPGTANWHGTSLPWMAIGYEYLQTPLQTLALYNAVANNGTLVRPQFVKEIRRGNEVVKTYAPEIITAKICSEKTLRDVQLCLEGVVKRGTGEALQSAYFDIAGKTGTAQVLNDDQRYGEEGEKKYQASFAGYFPANDPIYSCIVVIAAPSREIYGAKVSGTVFAAIANKVYASSLQFHNPVNKGQRSADKIPVSLDGFHYDLQTVYRALRIPYKSDSDAKWVSTMATEQRVEIKRRYADKTKVPNVCGMSAKDAVYLIESTGMSTRIEGFGRVVKQSIKPGTIPQAGVVVVLTLN
jgi:cell division protein FtsI (penicillin-binding protein 3)